jgi:thiol:disulfide interchange protein DsbC
VSDRHFFLLNLSERFSMILLHNIPCHSLFIGGFFLLAACEQGSHSDFSLDQSPQTAIRAALPSTNVSHIDCEKITGLCEIRTGKNVFYATQDGHYLLIGRVFDVRALEDMTEPVLLQLEPERMLAGAVGNKTVVAPTPRIPQRIAWSDLPKEGAVVWGKIGARKLAVFSDPKCPHCRKLSAALEEMDVEVHEYFVNFLGSRALSAAIICAEDQNAMRRSVFAGETPAVSTAVSSDDCDTSILDLNDQFAAAHRIQGTPLLISADGRVLPGFAGRQQLLAWLGGEQ